LQVSICPGGVPTGYTYFIPQEEQLESRVITRSYMEAKMVVAMSGRSSSAHMPFVLLDLSQKCINEPHKCQRSPHFPP